VRATTVRIAVRSLLGAALVTMLTALPAAALPTVVANEKFKWFYWAGPIMAVALLGLLLRTVAMYVRKVMVPKYRGRQAS
jgi:apolipoprotein N-acyltransferase